MDITHSKPSPKKISKITQKINETNQESINKHSLSVPTDNQSGSNSISSRNDSDLNLIQKPSSTDFSNLKKLSKSDFSMEKIIGKGSYGKVYLALYNNKKYALKVIDKKFVEKVEKIHEVHIERQILSFMDHPRIIKLYSTFQDSKYLYFVLDYCNNKDLSEFLHYQGKLSPELSQFYSAEIVSALEYLRENGISHRDLKPENILLDENMMIKIVDFATATIKNKVFDRKKKVFININDHYENNQNQSEVDDKVNSYLDGGLSLVGTAEYLSPEILNSQLSKTSEYYGSDLWALGCIIYRLFEGETPFKDTSEMKIFEKINNFSELSFSKTTPNEAKDLILKLLNNNPLERIGYSNISELKEHVFFTGIDFSKINSLKPPNERVVQMMTKRVKNKYHYSQVFSSSDMFFLSSNSKFNKSNIEEIDRDVENICHNHKQNHSIENKENHTNINKNNVIHVNNNNQVAYENISLLNIKNRQSSDKISYILPSNNDELLEKKTSRMDKFNLNPLNGNEINKEFSFKNINMGNLKIEDEYLNKTADTPVEKLNISNISKEKDKERDKDKENNSNSKPKVYGLNNSNEFVDDRNEMKKYRKRNSKKNSNNFEILSNKVIRLDDDILVLECKLSIYIIQYIKT